MKKPCHNPHDATFRLFLTDIEVARTFQKLALELPKQKEQLMTIAEQLKQEGREETVEKIVLRLLLQGMDIRTIQNLIGLSDSDIEKIKH